MKLTPVLLFIFFLTALIPSSHAADAAEKYQPGDSFAGFSTKDQHDTTYTYSGGARLIFVTFAMNPGKTANAFFSRQPANFLAEHRALLISSIYGMPGFVRSFVLPKMRKYPHQILLADTKDFLARYPEQEDKITVLRVDEKGTIETILFLSAESELAAIFKS